MKSLKYVSALLALGLASQAQATRYAWCEVQGPGEGSAHIQYQSGIIEFAEEDAVFDLKYGPFGQGFLKYVQSSFSPNSPHVECNAWNTFEDAEKWFKIHSGENVGKPTGWLGGRPAAVDRKESRPQYGKDDLILTLPGQRVKVNTQQPTNSAPAKQQWEIDYEHKMAKYKEELAKQQQQVADFERAKAETERMRAELAEGAMKARADHERLVARCRAEGRCAVSKQ